MKNHFANLTSLGVISVTIGISAIGYCFRMPFVSFLLGPVGIIFGMVSLKDPREEKLEKRISLLGIGLSGSSVIGGLINIYG